jgi:hypothetical protein
MPRAIACVVAVTVAFCSPVLLAQAPGRAPRLRITSSSVVELPGIARLDKSRISASVTSSDDDTVTVAARGGPNVTLPRPARRVIGELAGTDGETVSLLSQGRLVTVPRGSIAKIERSVGRRSRHRSVLLGLAFGAAAGSGIGAVIGASCHETGFLACFLEPAASIFAGALIGGGAGAVIGAFTPVPESWVTTPIDWVDQQPRRDTATATP